MIYKFGSLFLFLKREKKEEKEKRKKMNRL